MSGSIRITRLGNFAPPSMTLKRGTPQLTLSNGTIIASCTYLSTLPRHTPAAIYIAFCPLTSHYT